MRNILKLTKRSYKKIYGERLNTFLPQSKKGKHI